MVCHIRSRRSSPRVKSSNATTEIVGVLTPRVWSSDSDFTSHEATLTKNGMVAVLGPRPLDSDRTVQLVGECRDVTTTKETKGHTEIVALTSP